MTPIVPEWVAGGRGRAPRLRWSVNLEGNLTGLSVARETGHTFAADDAGGLYRFDRSGHLRQVSRSFTGVELLSWSDVGDSGAVALADRQIVWFDDRFQPRWKRELPEDVTSVAMDGFGQYLAVAQSNHRTLIFRSDRSLAAEFETVRPLEFLHFSARRNELVGASGDGFLCKHSLEGRLIWKKDLINAVGDMASNGPAELILLAAFNHGVQIVNGQGEGLGTFVLSGTPDHVAVSFQSDVVAASTQEGQICLLQLDGNLIWDAHCPTRVAFLATPPVSQGLVCGLETGRIVHLEWDVE